MNRLWRQTRWILPLLATVGAALAVVTAVQRAREARLPEIDLAARRRVSPVAPIDANDRLLRFAVASMVSAERTFATYETLVRRIGRDVGRAEVFVLRPTYAEVRQALENGQVDVAFVCTGTYLHTEPRGAVRLLVQPVFADGRRYRCLIIVPADSPAQGLEDLRGGVMAFTDPESNTGYLVPRHLLTQRGFRPETLFRETLFTGSHDRSITGVARHLVDAACVDSLVWQSKVQAEPDLAGRVRILWQSEAFGPPPVVVPAGIDPDLERALAEAFLSLHEDEAGRALLADIGIERFVPPRPDDYVSVRRLFGELQAQDRPR